MKTITMDFEIYKEELSVSKEQGRWLGAIEVRNFITSKQSAEAYAKANCLDFSMFCQIEEIEKLLNEKTPQ